MHGLQRLIGLHTRPPASRTGHGEEMHPGFPRYADSISGSERGIVSVERRGHLLHGGNALGGCLQATKLQGNAMLRKDAPGVSHLAHVRQPPGEMRVGGMVGKAYDGCARQRRNLWDSRRLGRVEQVDGLVLFWLRWCDGLLLRMKLRQHNTVEHTADEHDTEQQHS